MVDIVGVAREHGTPFYLIDTALVESAFRGIKAAFPEGTTIAYATKANYSASVIRTMRDLGASFDVFSVGEVNWLRENGVPPGRMIYTSVSETRQEFEYALRAGVRLFVVGSHAGFLNLASAGGGAAGADFLLRVQPIRRVVAGVPATGTMSKFGVAFRGGRDSADYIVPRALMGGGARFRGFHFHIGSQVRSPRSYVNAINSVMAFARRNRVEVGALDLGGGYPYPYRGEKVPPIDEFGRAIGDTIERWRGALGDFQLIIEPGRFLVAGACSLVARVANAKQMYGRRVLIPDASSDMVYARRFAAGRSIEVIPPRRGEVRTAIAGNMPHSLDWILDKAVALPRVEVGDLLVFRDVGAYAMSDNVTYGLRRVPKVVVVKDGKTRLEEHPFELISRLNRKMSRQWRG